MSQNLWVLRLKSIAWTIAGVAITAVAGYLSSSEFANLLQEYTGTATVGIVVGLIITEIMKHLRNKWVVSSQKYPELPGSGGPVDLI